MVGLLPWLGWLVAALAGCFQFLLQSSSGVMINDFVRDFSLNPLTVSLLTSSYYVTYLLFQIPAGIWIDFFKPRLTLFLCQLLVGLLFFLFSQTRHVGAAFSYRLLMGIVSAPTFVSAFYLIARTLPTKYFALVAGFTETLAMAGGLMGQALLARSVSVYGWRQSVSGMSFVAIGIGLLAFFIMRDTLIKDHEAHTVSNVREKIINDLKHIFLNPQAWLNGCFCGLLFGVIGAFGSFWCVSFLMKVYPIAIAQAADMSAMIFIGAAIGTPLIGWLSSLFGSNKLLMIIFSSIATVLLIIIIYFPPASLLMMSIWIALLGFFSSAYVLPFAIIRDITPVYMRGTAMGYINMMCILIGAPIMLPLVGSLLHWQGNITLHSFQIALVVVPFSALLGSVLAWFVRENTVCELNKSRAQSGYFSGESRKSSGEA